MASMNQNLDFYEKGIYSMIDILTQPHQAIFSRTTDKQATRAWRCGLDFSKIINRIKMINHTHKLQDNYKT